MNEQFEWQFGDEEQQRRGSLEPVRPASRRSQRTVILLALIVALIFIGWYVGHDRLTRAEENLRQEVQAVLDLERTALLRGDGELFFSFHADDPFWRTAQLWSFNQDIYRAGPHATRAEQRDSYVWANVSWTPNLSPAESFSNETWQRITFFQWQDGRLRHVPDAPGYWGTRQRTDHSWGALIFYETDYECATSIGSFIDDAVAELCEAGCLAGRLPFTVSLATHYGESIEPRRVNVLSPRLLALTEDGQPASLFWQQLRQRLEEYLMPATIRFAVPPPLQQPVNYQSAVEEFTAAHPHIQVELVVVEDLLDAPALALGGYDGAAVAPTPAMIAAGHVYDLTGFVDTDPTFDRVDFYRQIWPAAWWQERMWFVPQAALMRLVFYDQSVYRSGGHPQPALRWNWDELARDVAALAATADESTWTFIDADKDSLFAYAYEWQARCWQRQPATVRCPGQLDAAAVTESLAWYQQMVILGYMPDLTALSSLERSHFKLRQRADIWIDAPVSYENHLLMRPTGVVPFPGTNRFIGISPLWVQGNFITQASARPLATWEWLKFLSYQPLAARFRYVPARPSVAAQTGYWETLPAPLSRSLRPAFPFARPVTLEDQRYFTWTQLAAVASGQAPAEVAQRPAPLHWFLSNQE